MSMVEKKSDQLDEPLIINDQGLKILERQETIDAIRFTN